MMTEARRLSFSTYPETAKLVNLPIHFRENVRAVEHFCQWYKAVRVADVY